MKIPEIRAAAMAKFGAHSHQDGQAQAALGPIEEWLAVLAKYGMEFELVPKELWAKLDPGEPPGEPVYDMDDPVLAPPASLGAPPAVWPTGVPWNKEQAK